MDPARPLTVFVRSDLSDTPVPGSRTVLLTAVGGLDITTYDKARREIRRVTAEPPDVAVLDITGVFTGANLVRVIVE